MGLLFSFGFQALRFSLSPSVRCFCPPTGVPALGPDKVSAVVHVDQDPPLPIPSHLCCAYTHTQPWSDSPNPLLGARVHVPRLLVGTSRLPPIHDLGEHSQKPSSSRELDRIIFSILIQRFQGLWRHSMSTGHNCSSGSSRAVAPLNGHWVTGIWETWVGASLNAH